MTTKNIWNREAHLKKNLKGDCTNSLLITIKADQLECVLQQLNDSTDARWDVRYVSPPSGEPQYTAVFTYLYSASSEENSEEKHVFHSEKLMVPFL